ncbi:MAG: ABC transporter [Candidatus Methanogaster sp.]|uniref:ABC transporter n=1 Tax=Candidatus Methanogaster sp. TaxID=3386292 RepID=A0AC61L2C5_9EURY|nr:MAG: ABC transporter [ANME-2 cluster archaeon]
MTEALIELAHVWKIFGEGEAETVAVRDVSLTIEKGEFVAIIGTSGSGKSTLMNQIGILDTPTRGDVFINHHKVSDMSENERARVRRVELGFVFQQFNLIPTFTVLENVEIPMVLKEVEMDERREKASLILDSLELRHRLNYYPGQLSGGQQQRVAIARALVNDPGIILADEPTGNLDTKSGAMVFDILNSLRDQGKTIVLITHDPNLAGKTERTIRMQDGEVV